MVIHLEPDILQCEVKWTLGSITMNKTKEVMVFSWPISNLKRWCCESAALNMPANLENSTMATGLEKVSFHSNPKEEQCQKCSNYWTRAFISHAGKVTLKILQARHQQYVNWELPDDKLDLEMAKDQKSNCQHPLDHWKSKGIPEKLLLLFHGLC